MQFLSMSLKDFQSLGTPKSKYHAKKTTVNGVEYDSKKESQRAIELEYLERVGKIKNLQRQVRFILQEGYNNNEGKKIRPISYVADFVYVQNGQKTVEDTKGFRTEVYLLKKKIFMFKYPEYKFIES